MGFLISKEMPSRFLSGDEIVGRAVDVTIRDIKKEKARSPKTNKEENVIVVYFVGKDRGVCLGKERAKELVTICQSDDTDAWKGQVVRLFTIKKFAFGKENNILHFAKAEKIPEETKEELSKALDDISLNS